MAWDSAYADADEYRARTGKTTTGDDDDILEQLTAASRAIERCTYDVFNKTGMVTLLMDGRGGDFLPVNPSVVTLGELKVDTNGDGTYDATLTAGDLIARPQSVEALDERPIKAYQLHPNQTAINHFPHRVVAVELSATVFGWAAVPDAIREACVDLARSIRDLQLAGHTASLQNLDNAVALSPDVARVVQRLEGTYKVHGRAIPMPV